MNIKVKLLHSGQIFEGKLIAVKQSHLLGVTWITLEHPTEKYTNLWNETHKMLYGFRSDIIEVLEGQDVIEGYVGNSGAHGTQISTR